MKILCVASHPDDEILGCGGTIERLKKEGAIVHIALLGGGRWSAGDNKFDEKPLLWWVKVVEDEIVRGKPDIIFTHYEHDLNIDHQITYKAVITAARPQPDCCVKEIYSFEIPSSTEWAFPTSFSPDFFVDIGQTIASKLAFIKSHYDTEMRKYPHPRSMGGIKTLAKYRGHIIGVQYAEAFKTVRRII